MKAYPPEPLSAHPDVVRAKHAYGIWFGVGLGLIFSLFAWGNDAYLLSRMNGFYPWLKFLGGVVPCVIVGGLTGWLSARLEKPFLAMLLWGIAASVFAWLTVSLPLKITPRVLSLVEPEIQNMLHYAYDETFSSRIGIVYIWLALFISLAGLLQLPLSDTAVFSTSLFGKISPFLIIFVLMAVCGTSVDGLNNELLRAPVGAVNTTLQFVLDHRGRDIDVTESRQMHLGALRTVDHLITPQRKLIVSGFDQYLEQVQVLTQFEEGWVECDLILNQLVSCKQVGNPG
jgi:hypothetical protein